jgi:ubiquinone/menaquinone biosynthesis C-methylase UbiE
MSGPTMMVHLALERLSRRELARVPEAEMAMNDTVLNAAFRDAGRDDGVLAFLYLFHALRISAVILPGDRVLDLACGPANQLGLVARLNPESNFAGVDASPGMLAEARDTLARVGVENVSLLPGDMTNLVGIADASVDCVVSTMSLHHLPDPDALKKAMLEARRVLKPGGGVYIVDF